jgi:Dienelactone hydrolase family
MLRLRALLHYFNRNMTTVHNSNTACCSIPPVQSSYQPKGSFKSYAGFEKVYVTGPEDTGRALIAVFDIFGFWPQTQQGADILASTLGAKIVMPDFFQPDPPFSQDDYPPNTDEKMGRLQAFFGGPAKIDRAVGNVKKVGAALKAEGKKVGVYGYCWGMWLCLVLKRLELTLNPPSGGKVATLVGSDPSFDAVAAIHPA